MIFSALCTKNVHQQNLAVYVESPNPKAGLRKVERSYLALSWQINKKISLPLLFVDLNKAGNSNTTERLDLLKAFNEVFGFYRIKSLMADPYDEYLKRACWAC